MMKIELDTLQEVFQKEFIKKVKNCYDEYLLENTIVGENSYINKMGNYIGRNDKEIDPEISDYFERLLYAPNLCVLYYLVKNKSDFENLIFLDNGSSIGLLSVFLKKLGFKCYNYDNFSHEPAIKNSLFHEKIKQKTGLEIEPIEDKINYDFDVLLSCGIWIENRDFFDRNFRLMMCDSAYVNKGISRQLIISKNFTQVESFISLQIFGQNKNEL